METIFSEYYVIDNLGIFYGYLIAIVLMIIITVLFVWKELGGKK